MGESGSNPWSINGRAGMIVLFSSRPQSSSPKIVSNSLLFRLDQRYRWNFTILKHQELVFSDNIEIDRMKRQRLAEHLELPMLYEEFIKS